MVGILLLNKKNHKWKLSLVTTELPADTKNPHSWNIRNMPGSALSWRQKYWKSFILADWPGWRQEVIWI